MTAPALLGWISLALLVQLSVGVGWALWRRMRAPGAVAAVASPAPRATAWNGWRAFRVIRRVYEDPAQTQCSFYLQPVDGEPLPDFEPGQFLSFALDVAEVPEASRAAGVAAAPRSITRCYSLSDRPDPAHYRITIKRVPPPPGRPDLRPGLSSGHFHDHVHVSDVLRVKAPSGRFVIDPDGTLPAVLVAGGIGVTPMMSMLLWCLQRQPQRRVHLYHGVRNRDEQAFGPVLRSLAASHPTIRLHVVYSQPSAADAAGRDGDVFIHHGHIDVDLLRRTLPAGRHRFFVCGPPPMMQSLVPAIAAWGVPAEDLRHEAFGPASIVAHAAEPEPTAGPAIEVRFRRSGRSLAWDGRDASLLDFAERHGIAVDSGCRSGGCGTCETRVIDGAVAYAQPPDHDIAPGSCLLCVGRPVAPLVLEA